MTRRGHIPTRMCIACRTRRPKSDLVRFAVSAGEVVPDRGHAHPGRGCYLCDDAACLSRALKKGAFPRALKTKNVKTDSLAAVPMGSEARPETGVAG